MRPSGHRGENETPRRRRIREGARGEITRDQLMTSRDSDTEAGTHHLLYMILA